MNVRTLTLIILFLILYQVGYSQTERKKVSAYRTNHPVKIDGILDEPDYAQSGIATDFLQLNPYNGQPSPLKTEVRIMYDDNAIYFGIMCYDNPDSIRNFITTRDNIGVSDYFDVIIDPNNEGLTGYEFIVTPANSQTDLKAVKSGDGDYEDGSWDAVWQSATRIVENGWIAEMRIPYSALRFPANDVHVWGLNFFRRLRSLNTHTSWNFVDNKVAGFIQQSGELHGIEKIKTPVRLSLSPYVSAYYDKKSDQTEGRSFFKGGLDIKYGLSESHTLDMMLIPDFGQIQSDDEELNLSPYEMYYSEKRQFFVEGVELFNRADIFYSRRIGSKPLFSDISNKLNENETVDFNPNETQIINATKISGRDKNGWGLGFLNAMTLTGRAKVRDTLSGETREIITQNFTNYNVTVVEKAMPNNSLISLINTNLKLIGAPYMANVTGTEFQLKNKKQAYQLTGRGAFSYKNNAEDQTGFMYNISARRIKGKFRFRADRTEYSDTYDPNDMGYLRRNNYVQNECWLSYNKLEPFSIFKEWSIEYHFSNSSLHNPNKHIQNDMYLWSSALFNNQMWLGGWIAYNFKANDYHETRVKNRFFVMPEHLSTELNFSTNQNKKISFRTTAGFFQATRQEEKGNWLNLILNLNAGKRFSGSYNFSVNNEENLKGYVDHWNDEEIFFGKYHRLTLSNTLSMGYNFNTKMALNIRGRHYWSKADYNTIYLLNPNGTITPDNRYTDNPDVNFNAFNIDMVFKWEFAPGSELSVAWKNALYDTNKNISLSYSENVKEMFRAINSNSISLKLLYYIDYNAIFNKSKTM
jgi:hypothetical protein